VFAAPLPAGAFAVAAPERVPASTFKNGEYGARVSLLTDGWDMTLFGLSAWDKLPAYPRTITNIPLVGALYNFTPEHNRLAVSGATFTKDAWDFVFKGEAAYTAGKSLSVLSDVNPTGIVRRDTLDAMVGADRTLFKKLDTNVQFIYRRIFAYVPEIFQEKRNSSFASLWLKTGFLNGKLEPEVFVLTGLDLWKEKMIRPKITFKPGGNLEFSAGTDLFYGASAGLFGQFAGNNRVWLTTKYMF
jgi:hypothetical protein